MITIQFSFFFFLNNASYLLRLIVLNKILKLKIIYEYI